MTGLEKITAKINSDAQQRNEGIIAAAKKQCDAIKADAEKKGAQEKEEALKVAKAECENIITVANSGAAQQTRQTLLAAKVEAVNETLAKLSDALYSLPEDKYFATVIKLASESAMAGECTASLSAQDNARLPASFEAELTSALAAKNAKVTLTSAPANIKSGIILDYGNISIDCSFEAIIEENSDIYKAKISEIIF